MYSQKSRGHKVMGIKGRRVHMIEELSETIISFQRGNPQKAGFHYPHCTRISFGTLFALNYWLVACTKISHESIL